MKLGSLILEPFLDRSSQADHTVFMGSSIRISAYRWKGFHITTESRAHLRNVCGRAALLGLGVGVHRA